MSLPSQQVDTVEEPRTAAYLSIFGGLLSAFGGLLEASGAGTLGFYIGSTTITLTDQDRLILGLGGIIFGAIMIWSGTMLHAHPEEHVQWGAIVLTLSFLSIFTSLGGLILGFLLGGVGGIKAIRWKPAKIIAKSDNEIWKSYALEVIKDLDAIPGESDKVFAIYLKSGLDSFVSYLRQKDPDLTSTEATTVANRVLSEIGFRRKQDEERQRSTMATPSIVQGGTNTSSSQGETNTAQVEKKEKSWIDKWLNR
jgi:hypothetical protein